MDLHGHHEIQFFFQISTLRNRFPNIDFSKMRCSRVDFSKIFQHFMFLFFESWAFGFCCFSIQTASNYSASSTSLCPYTCMSFLYLIPRRDEEVKRHLRDDEVEFNTLPKNVSSTSSKRKAGHKMLPNNVRTLLSNDDMKQLPETQNIRQLWIRLI